MSPHWHSCMFDFEWLSLCASTGWQPAIITEIEWGVAKKDNFSMKRVTAFILHTCSNVYLAAENGASLIRCSTSVNSLVDNGTKVLARKWWKIKSSVSGRLSKLPAQSTMVTTGWASRSNNNNIKKSNIYEWVRKLLGEACERQTLANSIRNWMLASQSQINKIKEQTNKQKNTMKKEKY